MTAEDVSRREQYFSLATQYYATARAGFFVGAGMVLGNVLHRAIEFYLKGDLCGDLSPRELKDHHHNLPSLWDAFKTRHAEAKLSKHDRCVRALNRFEEIRYPDRSAKGAVFFAIPLAHPQPPIKACSRAKGSPAIYTVAVNDVDWLVRAIFDATSSTEGYFGFPPEMKSIIYRDNPAFPGIRPKND